MTNDNDLIETILALPDRARADFLGFFGIRAVSKAEITGIEQRIAASIALKKRLGRAKNHQN